MKESYLGVSVSPLTYSDIITSIQQRMEQKQQSTVIAVNPEKVMVAQQDETLRELINHSTFQIPDGVGILLASKLKGGHIRSRVTGVDMMGHLLDFAAKEGHGVFLYGAEPDVVAQARENIESRYEGIQIVGHADGYVTDEEALVSQIATSNARLLFVALGSPKQELWIRRNQSKLPNVLVFQGVGGSFDVYSGKVKRAPAFFTRFGLEWLYRLIADPKRWKRQLNLPKFLFRIMLTNQSKQKENELK